MEGASNLFARLRIQQNPAQLDHLGRVLGDVDAMLVTRRRGVDDHVSVQLRRLPLTVGHRERRRVRQTNGPTSCAQVAPGRRFYFRPSPIEVVTCGRCRAEIFVLFCGSRGKGSGQLHSTAGTQRDGHSDPNGDLRTRPEHDGGRC